MDEEFKEEATQKARKMISLAVQRYAADYVAEHVVSAVPLMVMCGSIVFVPASE